MNPPMHAVRLDKKKPCS